MGVVQHATVVAVVVRTSSVTAFRGGNRSRSCSLQAESIFNCRLRAGAALVRVRLACSNRVYAYRYVRRQEEQVSRCA